MGSGSSPGIGPDAISPEGRVTAQVDGSARTVAIPGETVRVLGVEQGDAVVRAYHPESETFLFVPVAAVTGNHWASEFL